MLKCRNKTNYLISIILFTAIITGPLITKKVMAEETPDRFQVKTFNNNIKTTSEFPQTEWWLIFNDSFLNNYVTEALQHNHDLKITTSTIEEARQLAREYLGHEFPAVSIQPQYIRQASSKNLTTPSLTEFAKTGPRLFAPGSSVNIFSIPLIASYEADLWQKNRKKTQIANKQVESLEESQNLTEVLIVTEVAKAYFSLLYLDKSMKLQNDEITALQESLNLTEQLKLNGLTSNINLNEARNTLLQAQNNLTEISREQAVIQNQLTVLIGKSPGESKNLKRGTLDSIKIPTTLNSGIPSELVLHRPDIKQIEANIQAANLEIAVARRAFFPSITLSGQYGYSSTKLSNLFDWNSHLANFVSSVAQTIFSGGARRAKVKASKANYEKTLEQYNKSLMVAFQEVEDNISNYMHHYNEYQRSISLKENSEDNLKLVNDKYLNGLNSYLESIPYQITSINANKEKQNSKINCLTDILGVYKALGGGN